MTYACVQCQTPTDRGAVICYPDEIVIVPLCPLHMSKAARFFREDGTPVVSMDRLN